MKFVYPGFLFALTLLSIPIIIHLFNFRRFKKIYFTNVKFLKELKEETNSRSRLKHLLVLLSRLLAVGCLVVAFAQPFIPQTQGSIIGGEKAISIFVDNSFSMDAISKEGTLIQQAINKAHEIAMAYKPSDRFQLLTNDFNGAQQRLLNREEFLDQLQQIKSSTSSRNLNEILLRQKEALVNSGSKENLSFIISDFQKSIYDLSTVKSDSTLKVSLIEIGTQKNNNVYIDTCYLLNPIVMPGQPVELKVRLRNSGDAIAENIPLKLMINGVQKSITTLSVNDGSFIETNLNFTITQPGWQRCEIQITDYPITFDDKYYFSFNAEEHAGIYNIYEGNEGRNYLSRLFKQGEYFILQNGQVSQVDYSILQQSRVVVLSNLKYVSSGLITELQKFVYGGGSLIIFPDSLMDKTSYQSLATALNFDAYGDVVQSSDRVGTIDTQSDVFKNVFDKTNENLNVPLVSKYFDQPSKVITGREVLLKLQGGSSLLSRYSSGNGKIYTFSTPLNDGFSDFVNHWLFVPTIYRIALLSKKTSENSYVIGTDQSFTIDQSITPGESVYHLINTTASLDIVPQHRSISGGISIYFSDQIKTSGNYDLAINKEAVAVASLNYNRKESDLSVYRQSDLNELIEKYNLSNFKTILSVEGSITKTINELNEGFKLWKYFIIATLLFLLLEVLLLKFLR